MTAPRFKTRRALAVIAALSTMTAGCCPLTMPQPVVPHADFADKEVRAGIADVDITPPLGLGLFGHGPEGRVAIGTQLRLHCQIFVIIGAAPASGGTAEAVALVPCDLSSPSLLLQRKITDIATKNGVPLGPERVLLMATHTHAAPGNFYGVKNYSGPFSTRVAGFDPRVLDFLATRIAGALKTAYDAANHTHARIAWWQGSVSDELTRNRDPHPFLQNRSIPGWLAQRISGDPKHTESQAVDPTLSVLRIDRRVEAEGPPQYMPYGIFATFGMHPTALSNTNEYYSGDVFGYATHYIASAVSPSTSSSKVVVGIANGIEGDVMPARDSTGMREARRFGHRLAQEIVTHWTELGEDQTKYDTQASVRVAYRELSLSNAQTAYGENLCKIPELGTPAGGGANDHPTLLRAFPQYNPGVTTQQNTGCSRPKLPVLMIFGEGKAGKDFPGIAPLTVAQIGSHYLVTLPAEITTMAGIRVREAVANELSLPAETDQNVGRSVVVVGLTNEYLQYVATREEYQLQYYEGASTLYGPASAEFLRDHAACLAHWLVHQHEDSDCRLGQKRDVNQFEKITYPDLGDGDVLSLGGDDLLLDKTDPNDEIKAIEAPAPEITRDGLLGVSVKFRGPDTRHVHKREDLRLEVHEETPSGSPLIADDLGTNVVTRYDAYARKWIATWVPELTDPTQASSYCGRRFHIVVHGASTSRKSNSFTLDCSRTTDVSKVWP